MAPPIQKLRARTFAPVCRSKIWFTLVVNRAGSLLAPNPQVMDVPIHAMRRLPLACACFITAGKEEPQALMPTSTSRLFARYIQLQYKHAHPVFRTPGVTMGLRPTKGD